MKEQGKISEKVVLKKQEFREKNKSCYSKHEKIVISTGISEVLEDGSETTDLKNNLS